MLTSAKSIMGISANHYFENKTSELPYFQSFTKFFLKRLYHLQNFSYY